MPSTPRRSIQVISHGPSCLDGVMAAVAVRRFYGHDRVSATLAANGDSDRILQAVKRRSGRTPEELWVTDLSWTSAETARHLRNLARAGLRIIWIVGVF